MDRGARTLSLIGAGRVGRTLAALWSRQGIFRVQDVLARTPVSTRAAVDFIGAGRPASDISGMRPADAWLIATPDAQIAPCCVGLAQANLLRRRDLVFHCSGSLPASELAAAAAQGAQVASVHPLKTFADPGEAARSFAGTYCIGEGDSGALAALAPAFEAIGGRFARIAEADKPLYHAAGVIVCNYLVSLMEVGLRCYERAGLERATALPMMESLVRETVENVFRMGTAAALTGPIARGDVPIVAQHLRLLRDWRGDVADIYRALGIVTLELARKSGADTSRLDEIDSLLRARSD